MTILVDMDNVVADLELHFYNRWRDLYPERKFVLPENRTTRNLEDDYSGEGYRQDIHNIIHEKGFFRNMPPIPGAVDALKWMLERDLDPTFCTAPLKDSTTCAMEKMEWVEEHLGSDWIRRVIIAKDKTKVRGDVLIDDNPQPGKLRPTWVHLLFDSPHNRSLEVPHRVNWDNWKEAYFLVTFPAF